MMQAPYEVNVSSRYGAPMGRRSDDESKFIGREVQLRRVPAVDHDYDPGGAYWGGIENDHPLFCAWGHDQDGGEIVMYISAPDREAAIKELPEGCTVTQPKIEVTECPDAFFYAYVEAALWSSTDESNEAGGEPLDANYSFDDLDPGSLIELRKECDKFYIENVNDIYKGGDDQAGHDFWLSRNGHGVGFGDRDCYGDDGERDRLQEAAREYGEVYLYVGDDGKVHCE